MKTKFGATLAALLIAATTAVNAGNITVKGSDTLVILAQKWAEVYMGNKPEVKIQVTGGGTTRSTSTHSTLMTIVQNAKAKR